MKSYAPNFVGASVSRWRTLVLAPMLRSLSIRQLAVVDELDLELEPGLNVLTGETGAGKSIVIRALAVLCGAKASPDLIRTDADEAWVEGLFEGVPHQVLEEHGLPPAADVVVRRVIYRNGRSRMWVNGSTVSATQLTNVGRALVRIYGQHEQTSLLRNETHLEILDAFGRLQSLREEMASAYAEWREAERRAARAREALSAREERLELLQFQIGELRQAAVTPGEEAQLQAERDKLRHIEKLQRLCSESEAALDAGEQPILQATARIAHALGEARRIDLALEDCASLAAQADMLLREVAFQLRRYIDRLEFDPVRYAEVEDRLALISRLKRKYRCEADDLAGVLENLEAQSSRLQQAEVELEQFAAEAARKGQEARRLALELSQARKKVARQLETKVRKELHALGMPQAAFQVQFVEPSNPRGHLNEAPENAGVDLEGLGPHGADEVEFYFSANPGEALRALARIASGGELSRIMLALKVLSGTENDAAVWIFDEVDAGIGGATATVVGKRLYALARQQQVLCITHLPQIAVFADHHVALDKVVRAGKTFTTARCVTGEERIRELSRMLGTTHAESERYVRELLASVKPS